MKKEIFNNILSESLNIYWGGNQYYPAETISEIDKEQLKDIICIRYHFDGAGNARENYDKVFEEGVQYLYKLLFEESYDGKCLIVMDHSAKPKNRIRSFKGILPKEIDKESYVQIEVPFRNNTIIGGIVLLTTENYRTCVNLIMDSRCGFILSSAQNIILEQYLRGAINNYRRNDNSTSIDYLRLILENCSTGKIIYKISGDGGDNLLAIDVFKSK